MGYNWNIQCPKCGTLVEVEEVNISMPYKTAETAECPICGETIMRCNSRGDLESRVISTENTKDEYKSRVEK